MERFLQGDLILSIVVVVLALLFLLFTVYQIKRGKLLLRYSLMWMLLSILMLVVAIFPEPVFYLSQLLGFSVSSNFIFSVAIFFLLAVCLTQSRATSQQVIKNKEAVQRTALLEKRLEDLERHVAGESTTSPFKSL